MNSTETESIRHQAKIAALPFVEDRATADAAQTLRDELLYHRATQTYLWALPLINTLGMQAGSEKTFGEGHNVLSVWKKRLDAKTLVTGATNYTLNLPKDVPAANFWSVTLYEAENASGLANGQPFPSLGSRDQPVQNADGSTDLILGPKPPPGQEKNWLATVPGKGYFAILRLYGPTEAALARTWKPGEFTKMK